MHSEIRNRLGRQKIGFLIMTIAAAVVIFTVAGVICFIARKGIGIISWEFLTQPPRKQMTEGGIFPAILGTFLLGVGSMLFAVPIGVLTAIFLVEFSRGGKIAEYIYLVTNTLAGVPSIVFGLFGFALFCKTFGFGVSLLSGALTLGIMTLPVVITTTVEALKAVPDKFREASLSLGATKWQTTVKVTLPNAISGIITGAILSMGRAVGETAPIIFTAATFYTRQLPKSPFDEVMALPYHIYGLVTEGIHADKQLPIAFGSAFILLVLVLALSGIGIFLRYRQRSRRLW